MLLGKMMINHWIQRYFFFTREYTWIESDVSQVVMVAEHCQVCQISNSMNVRCPRVFWILGQGQQSNQSISQSVPDVIVNRYGFLSVFQSILNMLGRVKTHHNLLHTSQCLDNQTCPTIFSGQWLSPTALKNDGVRQLG